jgi:hypothetical protein
MDHDILASTVTDYELNNRGSIPCRNRDYSLRHHIQIGSGEHSTLDSKGTRSLVFGDQVAAANKQRRNRIT